MENSLTLNVNLLMDIPELPWRKIVRLCQADDNDIWSLSLACPDLDTRLIRDCPVIVKKSMVANKIVAVLTRNEYLAREDLLCCFNSGSERLENCAAKGWRYIKNREVGRIVELNDSRAILRFMEDVKREKNVWHAFIWSILKLDGSEQQTPHEQENYLTTVKTFLRRYGKFVFFIDMNSLNYESFQQTNFANLVNLRKLILRGTKDHLRTLTLLAKFPKVRDVTLHCSLPGYGEQTYDAPPRAFPFVRKLTLLIDRIAPVSLDEIPNVLPSLRSFCLRAEMSQSELQNLLKEWKNRGRFENYVIDIYDLYADGESLIRSNIWQHMKNLNTLVVKSIAEDLEWEPIPGVGMDHEPYTKRNEIYSRNEDTITLTQETFLDHEWHYDLH